MVQILKGSCEMDHGGTVRFRWRLTNKVFRLGIQQYTTLFENLSRTAVRKIFLGLQSFQGHHRPISVSAEQPFQRQTDGQRSFAGRFHEAATAWVPGVALRSRGDPIR